jgi:hypothetical protein
MVLKAKHLGDTGQGSGILAGLKNDGRRAKGVMGC